MRSISIAGRSAGTSLFRPFGRVVITPTGAHGERRSPPAIQASTGPLRLGSIRLDWRSVACLTLFFSFDAAIFVWLIGGDLDLAVRLRFAAAATAFVIFMMGSLVAASAISGGRLIGRAERRSITADPPKLKSLDHISRFLSESVAETLPQGMTVGLLWAQTRAPEGTNATTFAGLEAEAGQRLLAAFRRDDAVAHIGAGEFVVVASRLAGRSALPALKKRAARALAGLSVADASGVRLEAIVGSAVCPVDGYGEADLIRAARLDAVLRGETSSPDRTPPASKV